ncbi:MAG: sugar ABC transporter permease [Anaerolineae bacterium]|nr:sugar ABC transporter permease [Anaerolineae bacterium]
MTTSFPTSEPVPIETQKTPRKKSWTLYLWIAPALIIYTLFKLLPMIAGVFLSLLRWDGIKDPVFIGLLNYQRMFTDDQLTPAFLHNLQYALGTVTGKILISLLLAILLNQALRGQTIYRTVLFMPVVLSFVVISVLWTWLYNDQFGLVNSLLRFVHLDNLAVQWLGDAKYALISVMFVDIWKWYGFHMVIFLAALQTIPQEYYEAARVDGASRWAQFTAITLPQLRPVMVINITLALLGAFNVFDIPYIMTQGGPAGATNVLALYSYQQAFQFGKLGYGAAISYALLILVSIVALVQLRIVASDETYAESDAN